MMMALVGRRDDATGNRGSRQNGDNQTAPSERALAMSRGSALTDTRTHAVASRRSELRDRGRDSSRRHRRRNAEKRSGSHAERDLADPHN